MSLYFSNEDERSGKGINCIAQTEGNPRDRWLRTEHKKSLNLLRGEMSLVSENGGNSITMGRSNVNFKGTDISISGKAVNISGAKLFVIAKGSSILMGCGPFDKNEDGGIQQDPTAFIGLVDGDLQITGDNGTVLTATGTESYDPYPDGPEEGHFNWGKAAARAAVTVVVIGGSAVLVCASMGASVPVLAGAAATGAMAGGGVMVSDAIKGKVSSWEDYALSVAGAELMFFTNLAATQIISITGMGFVSGTALKGVSAAAAEATMDYLVEGEIDYERLARNLIINIGVDLALGSISGEAWGKQGGTVENGHYSGADGSERVREYWSEYYSKAGTEGDYIDDLIESAKRRPYGRHGNLSVEKGEFGSYLNGTIQYGENTKRWEFIEEFLHYNVDKNHSLQNIRKEFKRQLKANGVQGNLGRAAEEMAVKKWLLDYSNLLGLDNATKELLRNQIEQLGKYGIKYGY